MCGMARTTELGSKTKCDSAAQIACLYHKRSVVTSEYFQKSLGLIKRKHCHNKSLKIKHLDFRSFNKIGFPRLESKFLGNTPFFN